MDRFDLSDLGPFHMTDPCEGLPPEVWAESEIGPRPAPAAPRVPDNVLALVEERQASRARHDWAAADVLRAQIIAAGWQVKDTPNGPVVEPV